MSSSWTNMKWIAKLMQVYSQENRCRKEILFLHIIINDQKIKEMTHVDMRNKLCNYYCFDHSTRKKQWWWNVSFWFWCSSCQCLCLLQKLHAWKGCQTVWYTLTIWLHNNFSTDIPLSLSTLAIHHTKVRWQTRRITRNNKEKEQK